MQVLTIMRVRPGTDIADLVPYFEAEATRAWELYASGTVRAMHSIADAQGVVFLWEAPDVEAVSGAVSALPMMQAGFLDVDVIPLRNYTGFDQLFRETVAPGSR